MRKNKLFRLLQALSLACLWLVNINAMSEGIKQSEPNLVIIVNSSSQKVTVRLPANPSTGYQWIVKSYDKALMEFPSSEYMAKKTGMVGATGVAIWRFKFKPIAFKSLHKTTVILEYRRPWENSKSNIKQQIICFVIK